METSRYAVGLDIGTTTVRAVVGHVENAGQSPSIVGIGIHKNTGMRKGVIVNLVNAAQAIDKALEDAERMSGHQIDAAAISVNGSHLVGMASRGVVAVGSSGHEITQEDLARVEEAATVVQLPANREILEVTPRSYQLDSQENIKDPLGMTGIRLEVDAYVITALSPHVKNLLKAAEMTETTVSHTVPASLAAAKAVLSDQQMENGVVLVDMGGTTTNLAVYEEGDLQHVATLPIGSVNITNDLAIGLKTDLDIAEAVKLEHATATPATRKVASDKVMVKIDGVKHEFDTVDVDDIVDARLEELFEHINKELKSVGRAAKLPGGVVLTGGGAQLKGIADYAKEALQLSARVGKPSGYGGMTEHISDPGFASALGLMLVDLENAPRGHENTGSAHQRNGDTVAMFSKISGAVSGVMGKFRS